jgi:hypothetical protein
MATTATGTVINAVGLISRTQTGTNSLVTDSTGRYLKNVSSTALNTTAGLDFISGDAETEAQFGPDITFVMKTGPASTDVTNVRIWVGIFSVDPSGSADPAGHRLAFRFDTGAGDTVWQAVSKDGTTQGISSTGTSVTADTRYVMRIDGSNAASVDYYINGSLVATRTTNLPGASTALAVAQTITNLSAGTARAILWARYQINQN